MGNLHKDDLKMLLVAGGINIKLDLNLCLR